MGKDLQAARSAARSYGYYPGCSAHGTARELDESLRVVFDHFAIRLSELHDWNCCGASSAHSLSRNLALALSARNLVIIKALGLRTLTACPACFSRLRQAHDELDQDASRHAWLTAELGGDLGIGAQVCTALEVLLAEVGLPRLRSSVLRPLEGLRIVCYYGCLLARPATISALKDQEHPAELESLMGALGAENRSWSYAVDCCGGSLSVSRPASVRAMTGTLVQQARKAGAEMIITACPMCQVNLELRQPAGRAGPLPCLYFTEAIGVALQLEETERWLSRHLIDPRPLLEKRGLIG